MTLNLLKRNKTGNYLWRGTICSSSSSCAESCRARRRIGLFVSACLSKLEVSCVPHTSHLASDSFIVRRLPLEASSLQPLLSFLDVSIELSTMKQTDPQLPDQPRSPSTTSRSRRPLGRGRSSRASEPQTNTMPAHLEMTWTVLNQPPCLVDAHCRVLPAPGATKITRRQLRDTIQEALDLIEDEIFEDSTSCDPTMQDSEAARRQ